ncbi:Imm49 family immunity protein [Archangium sp.]|uniref:Imm49 family immunity protein n=1 Tax=Archangium sp. TaxID=1872627 RepID=UPI00389AF2BD
MHTVILNLSHELSMRREALPGLKAGQGRARLLHQISSHERMLAIALLLAEADTEGFFRHLAMSGEAHKQLLLEVRDVGQVVRFAASGNVHPFCDALVAGHEPLAREIANLSPGQWMPGEEYEEDFVYGRFLHFLLLDGFRVSARQEALLARMAELDEEPDARQRLCRALFERDASAFETSLADASRAHEQHCEELEARRFSPSAEGQTERYVFIEGLALLRMAEAVGIRTEPEHRLMPSLARWKG